MLVISEKDYSILGIRFIDRVLAVCVLNEELFIVPLYSVSYTLKLFSEVVVRNVVHDGYVLLVVYKDCFRDVGEKER